MSTTVRHAIMLLTILGLVSVTLHSRAETPNNLQSPVPVDADTAKSRVLQWIDDFREEQVLFHDRDIAGLQKTLVDDTPEAVVDWWIRTKRIRAALESPQWKETRDWYREFLRMQAIFSDEQIDQLRDRAWHAAHQETSKEFRDLLAEVTTYRNDLRQSSADSRKLRDYQLRALAASRNTPSSQRIVVAQAARFATNRRPVQPREPRYSPPPPLITSREVARWSVARIFWRWW